MTQDTGVWFENPKLGQYDPFQSVDDFHSTTISRFLGRRLFEEGPRWCVWVEKQSKYTYHGNGGDSLVSSNMISCSVFDNEDLAQAFWDKPQ